MSWITLDNLRRFVDKLFHDTISFDGSVTHNGADEFNGGVKVNTKPLEINGGVKVNTTKAEFNAPVSLNQTTTYKGSEIATKGDVSSGSNITVDDALSATSTNPVQNKVVNGALNKKLSTDGGMVNGNVSVLGNIKASSLSIGDVAAIVKLISGGTGDMAREQDGKLYTFLDTSNYTEYVPKLDGNGHLIINGSKLWIA